MTGQALADTGSGANPVLRVAHGKTGSPADRLVLAYSPYHPRSEQVRMLRTELLLRHEDDEGANAVAVLSPGAAEGRSQLAAELAIAFAQLGRPTLLVDADLRRPQQHLLFNADNSVGLAQAIAHEQLPRFQSVKGLPSLFLLTAGPPPPNPLELLSDRSFELMVADWRQHFQFVVIDTPPVARYADGLAVATVVGRVLTMSRARHTRYRDTRDMLRRLGATQARILGAVINHF
jgi:protein-tyrosine kinase